LLSHRTRRLVTSPRLLSSGCHVGQGARSTRTAATPKAAPSTIHWDRVSRGLAGGSWSEFCAKVAALRPGRLWRYAQAELGIAPVVTLLARAYSRRATRRRFKRRRDEWAETIGEWRNRTASLPRYTPAGRRIAICPATYSDATCKTCGACARVRDAVIGFPAHGAWRKVEHAMAARDVPGGESWAIPDHRTMAQVIAEEAA
jgi:hypothetical protein